MHTSKHMRCICPSGPGAVAQVCLISCLGDTAFCQFLDPQSGFLHKSAESHWSGT